MRLQKRKATAEVPRPREAPELVEQANAARAICRSIYPSRTCACTNQVSRNICETMMRAAQRVILIVRPVDGTDQTK